MNIDALHQRALAHFFHAFDRRPVLWASAPGRVNLIGEHTDYNNGFVLPCAIERRTVVAVGLRSDHQVRVVASDLRDARDIFSLDKPVTAHPGKRWATYVRAVFEIMQRRGLAVPGLDLVIAGDVPQGGGLSSSASLEVAITGAVRAMAAWSMMSDTDLALLAQAAENGLAGCACGIMDQLISARATKGHAAMIDCRDLSLRQVPLPADVSVVVAHSRVKRGLVESAYNERRQQCQAAANALGVSSLREADMNQLEAARPNMDAVVWRRARHVVSENARTLAAADALANGRLGQLSVLMRESHASMRDDFEITVPAVDRLVTLMDNTLGTAGGARMTGGGFGGCAVAIAPDAMVNPLIENIAHEYRSPDGEPAEVFVTHAAGGLRVGRYASAA